MQWGVGWGEVQVEGACREHVVYTEPNWQRDGLNNNVRCCAGWRDRMRLWEKKLNKATRMEMETEHNVVELDDYEVGGTRGGQLQLVPLMG